MYNRIIDSIYKSAKDTNAKVYIVGGCIRDYLLNRPIYDIDIVVYNSSKFLKIIHQHTGGKLICLDNKRQIFRLIPNKKYTIDITYKPKEAILENLSMRDFSINAMALYIDHIKNEENIEKFIIDPFNGRDDLKKGIIQIINSEIFKKDPIRLIRAYRISAQLSFQLSKKTNHQIKLDRELIISSAKERIREELLKLLSVPMSVSYIKQMHKSSLLSIVFPEILEMADSFQHSLTTLFFLEKMLEEPMIFFNPISDAILINKIKKWKDVNKSNIFCLKMAAIFHDIGMPTFKVLIKHNKHKIDNHAKIGALMIKKRTKYLRFSLAESNTIATFIEKHHLESLFAYQNKQIKKQKLARFFLKTGNKWFDILLLYIANNCTETIGSKKMDCAIEFVKRILNSREQMEANLKEKPLINGNDLKKSRLCKPGPLMGKILDEIKELTFCGDITSKKEALSMAQYLIKNKYHINGLQGVDLGVSVRD